MPENSDDSFTSLRDGSTDANAVRAYYDDWAKEYDSTLDGWDYRAPGDACDLLAPCLASGAHVLDVGCGTGLFGAALRARCDAKIDGLDISPASLDRAGARAIYAHLLRHDLNMLPLPADTNAYDAAASVGVLTYIENAEPLLRDLCRVVRPGGAIVFTQRDDLWTPRDFPQILDRLSQDGMWRVETITQPRAYLPGNDEFGDEIKVIHVLCKAV